MSIASRRSPAIFLGTHAEVSLRSASGQSLTLNLAIENAEALPAEGSTVEVGWDPAATVAVRPD